jgi:hypothetical protein
MVAADTDATLRVPRVLGVFGRGAGLDDFPAHAPGKAHYLVGHHCAGPAKKSQGVRVLSKFNAHGLKQRLGVVLYQLQNFFISEIIDWHPSFNVRTRLVRGPLSLGASRATRGAAISFLYYLIHGGLLVVFSSHYGFIEKVGINRPATRI